MPLFSKPLTELMAPDIQALIDRQQQEDIETEFKQALSTSDGRQDRWMADQSSIGRVAKEVLTKEIVAFANTQGGTLVLGIGEDEEKRAASIHELPQCKALAERLGQSIMSSTDPKITALEVAGVPINGDAGVVVFRVPASVRAPHRDKDTRECYRRRGDSSEPMDMREIQDLTVNRLRGIEQIEARLEENAGLMPANHFLHVAPDGSFTGPHLGRHSGGGGWRSAAICGSRAVAVPVETLQLVGLADRQELKLPRIPITYRDGQRGGSGHASWHPILRGIKEGSNSNDHARFYERRIYADAKVSVERRFAELRPSTGRDLQGIPASWLLQTFAELLVSVETLRKRTNRESTPFALFAEWRIPSDVYVLPSDLMFYDGIYCQAEYNQVSEYVTFGNDVDELFGVLERDFWHSCGQERWRSENIDFAATLTKLGP